MTDKRIYVEQRPQGDYAVPTPKLSASERCVYLRSAKQLTRARELNKGDAPHVERVRYPSKGSLINGGNLNAHTPIGVQQHCAGVHVIKLMALTSFFETYSV